MTDAQVLTTVLISARFFGGKLVVAKHCMEQHRGQNRFDKSGFTRRLHALTETLLALLATVGDLLKYLPTETRYVLDFFLVAVCHNMRITRCKLLMGKAYKTSCASKRSWFYSLNGQVVATSDGLSIAFYIWVGADSEQTGRRCLELDLPEGCLLYTDVGYTDYLAADLFNEASGSQQPPAASTADGPKIRRKAL